jgi:hypothetical protein
MRMRCDSLDIYIPSITTIPRHLATPSRRTAELNQVVVVTSAHVFK